MRTTQWSRPNLLNKRDRPFAQAAHLLLVVRAHERARRVDEHALAGLEIFEAREADVRQLLVARVDQHDGITSWRAAASDSARS